MFKRKQKAVIQSEWMKGLLHAELNLEVIKETSESIYDCVSDRDGLQSDIDFALSEISSGLLELYKSADWCQGYVEYLHEIACRQGLQDELKYKHIFKKYIKEEIQDGVGCARVSSGYCGGVPVGPDGRDVWS